MDENQNLDMVVKEEPKRKIIIISLLLLVFISIIAFSTYIVISNRYVKAQRFAELLGKDQAAIESISKIIDIHKNAVIDGKVTMSMYGEEVANAEYNMIGTKDGFDLKGEYLLENESGEINIIKEERTVAAYIPALYEKYFAVNDENLEQLLLNLGYNIKTKEEGKINKSIRERYIKLLAKELDNYIEVKSDSIVTEESKEYKTLKYELVLDGKALSQIAKSILEKIENDEELKQVAVDLAKENLMQAYGVEEISEEDTEEIRKSLDEYISDLKSDTEYIEDYEIEIKIAVHEKDGKNIKTEVIINSDNGGLKAELLAYTYKKKDIIKFSLGIEEKTLAILFEKGEEESSDVVNILASFDGEEIFKISGEAKKAQKAQKAERKVRKLESLETFLLNTASEEELEQFMQKIMGIEPLEIEE